MWRQGAARSFGVVILEDDELYRAFLEEVLKPIENVRLVASFGCLSEMMDQLSNTAADVLLLDLGLPGTDGIAALPAILARFPGLKVLVLTGDDHRDSVIQALRNGASGYLVKTAPPEELLEGIRKGIYGETVVSGSALGHVVSYLHSSALELDSLTQRERETLLLLRAGQSYKQVAHVMGVSINTVRTHVRALYRKLEVRSRAAASQKTSE
jgi:DNA-binding NarL/FixJ family response regulator